MLSIENDKDNNITINKYNKNNNIVSEMLINNI